MSERLSSSSPTVRIRGLKGGHATTTAAPSTAQHLQHHPSSPHPQNSSSARRQRQMVCFESPCGAIDEDDSYYAVTTRPKGLKNVGNTCYANATLQCILNTALSHAITDPVASAIFQRYSSNPNILAQGSGSVDLEMDGGSCSCGGENNTTTTGTSSTVSKNSLSSARQRKLMLRERKRLEHETMYENCQWLSAELRQLTLEYHAPDVNRSSNHNNTSSTSSSSRYWMMYGGSKTNDTYVVDPGSVTRNPHRLSSSLTPYLQEDAHEFLRAFLGTLVMQGQNKELSSLFDGLLESSVTCQTCYRPSLTRDRYMDLSLDIADPRIESLSDALCEFTTTELLSGENTVFCRNCECKRVASKGLRLATAPSILVCHFKRFAYDEKQHKLVRLKKKITFPLRLEIGDYMSKVNQARPPPYELVSVLVHQGNSCEYGHYLAYVKHSGFWYKCNDSSIEPVDVQTVLNQQAYILMYEVAEMREVNGFGSHHTHRGRCNTTDQIASIVKTKNGAKYSSSGRNSKKPSKDDLLSYYTSKLWCGMDDSPLMWSELCQNYSNCWRMNDGEASSYPTSSSRRSGGRSTRRSSSSSTSSRKKRGANAAKDMNQLHHSTGALHHNLCHGDDLSTLGDTTVESTDTKRRFLRSSSSGNLRDVGDHHRESNHHDGHHGRGVPTGRSHSVSARHRRQNSNQTTPGNFDSTSTTKSAKGEIVTAVDAHSVSSALVTPKNRTNPKSPHRRSSPGSSNELPPRPPSVNNMEGNTGGSIQQLII